MTHEELEALVLSEQKKLREILTVVQATMDVVEDLRSAWSRFDVFRITRQVVGMRKEAAMAMDALRSTDALV